MHDVLGQDEHHMLDLIELVCGFGKRLSLSTDSTQNHLAGATMRLYLPCARLTTRMPLAPNAKPMHASPGKSRIRHAQESIS